MMVTVEEGVDIDSEAIGRWGRPAKWFWKGWCVCDDSRGGKDAEQLEDVKDKEQERSVS